MLLERGILILLLIWMCWVGKRDEGRWEVKGWRNNECLWPFTPLSSQETSVNNQAFYMISLGDRENLWNNPSILTSPRWADYAHAWERFLIKWYNMLWSSYMPRIHFQSPQNLLEYGESLNSNCGSVFITSVLHGHRRSIRRQIEGKKKIQTIYTSPLRNCYTFCDISFQSSLRIFLVIEKWS